MALLDEEGIDGLTMRRLAERIGSGVTTLYWHVDTKDDVVDLALDAIFGELPPAPPADTDWRAAIVALLLDWRTAMLRHPGRRRCSSARRWGRTCSPGWSSCKRPWSAPGSPATI